jgi:hypothetical protein
VCMGPSTFRFDNSLPRAGDMLKKNSGLSRKSNQSV